MGEGRIPADDWERRFYELALKCSGAVQAGGDGHQGRRRIHLLVNGPTPCSPTRFDRCGLLR